MSTSTNTSPDDLPFAERKVEDLPGHWLLARLGKRVLRPGGRVMTEQLLDDASLTDADVVELAPGLGKTAASIMDRKPRDYVGVESDPAAAALTESAIGGRGRVVSGDGAATGIDDASTDAVVAEAMLTMQSDKHKAEIVAEAFRILRPGGRYAIHEMSLNPDTLSNDQKTDIRRALARSIKVNARPLTEDEWRALFTEAGFTIERVRFAPMSLLEPRRVIADEGFGRTLRFVVNVIREPAARKRIVDMRSVFTKYKRNLAAIEIVAVKPQTS
ncbi:methyltransferase domain-containing protein [Gordonia zhaorongruii]|uniref:methyltransferase domain-containing protein n=1 Tax=Gordonia zhaorongruii TaxID=2597659 RepID=UPI001043B518|nr:methyltransferase domain-containing protein [Gordonia zhaorongruii]